MLTLENLAYNWRDFSLRADFSVRQGETVALIGPSGAGKSTLLNLIAGFLAPSAGRILFNGQDVTHHAPGARSVAMLFQDNNLFPHLTALQNVGLGIRPNLRLTPKELDQAQSALARVGLAAFATRKPGVMSGGQQSRVALARILVQRKPLILLDEPFAALGPALKDEMLDLVAEVAADLGATLLMVSHDPDDARRIAAQSILVADGVAAAPVTTQALLDNPPAALRAYLGG